MECPHCHQTLPFVVCSECKARIAEDSLFCSRCGKAVVREETKTEESDFSERILCSDGTCIGVINEKGVCNICGKPLTGEVVR